MTAVVAVANQKGGVGKTASVLGLADAVTAAGGRVLVVDLDPQANATDVLGADPDRADAYAVVGDPKRGGGAPLVDAVQHASDAWPRTDVVAATGQLAEVDVDTAPTQPTRLRLALRDAPLADYDVVLLDCPPSLGRLLVAGLVAATHVLVVTEPTGHALAGVGHLEETVSETRTGFDQMTPALAGVLLTRVKRAAEHAFRAHELREAYGDLVLPAEVPERVAVTDAASSGRPLSALPGHGARATAAAYASAWTALRPRLSTPGARP